MSIKLSVGWKNSEGFSEDQVKSFKTEEDAFVFCTKHIDNIMRIGELRIQRNPASYTGEMPDVIEISEKDIRKEIKKAK